MTLRLAAFGVFATVWQAYALISDSLLLPTFTDTMVALAQQLTSVDVWSAFAVSNVAMVIGFIAAVLTGVPVGLLIGRFQLADRVLTPYLVIILAVPLAGIIPLMTMSVGIGLASRVAVVWSFAVVMVVETCRAGVRSADPHLIDMVRLFGASEIGIWRRVLLPAALPSILSGIRIGLARSIEGMVVVELIMVAAGIGGLILRHQALFQGPQLYAIVLMVIAESLVLLWFVDAISRRLFPWTDMDRGAV